MLTKIYIHNYKCLVNFEWKPGKQNLFIGENGSGKSAVFEAIRSLKGLATGGVEIEEAFAINSQTQWLKENKQTISIEINDKEYGIFEYELIIEHKQELKAQRVFAEKLRLNKTNLLIFEGGEVTLYKKTSGTALNPFSFDWRKSFLANVLTRPENKEIIRFKAILKRLSVAKIVPPTFEYSTEKESDEIKTNFSNFLSWYKKISNKQGVIFALLESLKAGPLPYFQSLEFKGGPIFTLDVRLKTAESKSYAFDFRQLSDGQKMLIALYALLFWAKEPASVEPEEQQEIYENLPTLLFLDEPANFVSLAEIQPWLKELRAVLDDTPLQVFLTSHNPEIINYLCLPNDTMTGVFKLERPEGTHTRIHNVTINDEGLAPAELLARGWL